MDKITDYNILFLQVMAHDLLAPLTAVKWQTELIRSHVKDDEKREQYLEGISDSTELGIMLARHAHVAAKVFSGTYEGLVEKGNLSEQIEQAVTVLFLQYERHGLTLDADIKKEEHVEDTDEALVKLFVWSVAKFFLTVTPPQTKVHIKGGYTKEGKFVFRMSAPNIPEREELTKLFSDDNIDGPLDQKHVFVKLILEIAPKIFVDYRVDVQSEDLNLIATFS